MGKKPNKQSSADYKQKFKDLDLKRKEAFILDEDVEELKQLEARSIKKAVERKNQQ